MKVLVTEKVLRRTVARLISEARGFDNFLRKMTPQDLGNDEAAVYKLLNMMFLENFDSSELRTEDPNISIPKLGSSYTDAVTAFREKKLDGKELNGYLIAYLTLKYGARLPVKSVKGGVPVSDVAGDLNTILQSLGYAAPHSLTQLNRFIEGLIRGGPVTPPLTQEPGSAATPRDPSIETGTVTYYDIDPTDTETKLDTQELKSVPVKLIIDELISGSKITAGTAEAIEKYRKESIGPLNNSLKIITDAMITSRGMGSLLTVDMFTPAELEAVAEELLRTYDNPATRAASAQRPPRVSAFALVDACNITHAGAGAGGGTVLGVVGAALLISFVGIVATPRMMPARALDMLNSKQSSFARLQLEVAEAQKVADTVGDAASIERLNKIKAELLELETSLDETLQKITATESDVLSSTSLATYTGATGDVAAIRAGVQRRAAELINDKAALDAYKREYEAYREAYNAQRADVLARFKAAKDDLDAPYLKDIDRKTPTGVPMPTQSDYLARATDGLTPAEADDFRKILITTAPPPFRPPPAAGTGISPDDPAWQRQIDEIEAFKKQFDEIDRLKQAKREIEIKIGAKASKIDRGDPSVSPPRAGTDLGKLDARIEAARTELQKAKDTQDQFEKAVARLEELGGNAFDRTQIMTWLKSSLADYKKVYGIKGLISNVILVTLLCEIIGAVAGVCARIISQWSGDEQLLHRRLEAGFANLGSFAPEAGENTLAELAEEISEISWASAYIAFNPALVDKDKLVELAQAIARFARESVKPEGVTPEAVTKLRAAAMAVI